MIGFRCLLALALFVPCSEASAQRARPATDDWSSWVDEVTDQIRRSEYEFTAGPGESWSAPNRARGLRARIGLDGLLVEPRERTADAAWNLRFATVALGRSIDDARSHVRQLSAAGSHVELQHDDFLEWFRNDERGIEHGWTIEARPDGPGSSPILVAVEVAGEFAVRVEQGARSLLLEHGDVSLRYGGLAAFDATGTRLPARFVSRASGFAVEVDDRGARYPILVDPVLNGADWIADGGQIGEQHGFSIATAGDVNGDGYADVVVGAPYYDFGAAANAGRAFVYYGSPTGLPPSASWIRTSSNAGAQYGRSVACAGDVNGDGYSDVVIGAPYFNPPTGIAEVFLGGPTGLPPSPSFVLGEQHGFGFAVACAGDVNGDGLSDLVIGAPHYPSLAMPPKEIGAAYVALSQGTGWNTTGPLLPTDMPASVTTDREFGCSVAGVGDVDGDGLDDFAVGDIFAELTPATAVEQNYGSVDIFKLDPVTEISSRIQTFFGDQQNARYGVSVAGVGDTNGDGFRDLVIGMHNFDGPEVDEGRFDLHLGNGAGFDAVAAWSHQSDQVNGLTGHSVAAAGDVNGDGLADVVVGSYGWDAISLNNGKVELFLGRGDGTLEHVFEEAGDRDRAHMGWAVGGSGDVNGDGYADVLSGASTYHAPTDNEGRTFGFHGSPSDWETAPTWSAMGDVTSLPTRSVTAGDWNGDGFTDVAVNEVVDSEIWVYDGAAGGPELLPSAVLLPTATGNVLGRELSNAGDVNGDGYADLLVNEGYAACSSDRVHLYLGSSAGLATTPAWTTASSSCQYGLYLSAGGDLNGDGYADFVLGDPEQVSSTRGSVYGFFGCPDGPGAAADWTVSSSVDGLSFGYDLDIVGDVNGDGYDDVVVGTLDQSGGFGSAYLFHGGPTGPSTTPDWSIFGDPMFNRRLGRLVEGAGDVNQDGFADVLVGDTAFSDGELSEGEVRLYLGSPSGLPATPDWRFESNIVAENMGLALSAGDVDRDGYGDVVLQYGDPLTTYLFRGASGGPEATPSEHFSGYGRDWLDDEQAGLAGDVNGDGYPDFYAVHEDSQANATFVFLGHEGNGNLIRAPRQRQPDGLTPIALGGTSEHPRRFRIEVELLQDVAGVDWLDVSSTEAFLEWEVKPHGASFDGTGIERSAVGVLLDTATFPVTFSELVTGLTPDTRYHWRARIAFEGNPLVGHTPWFTLGGRAAIEQRLRTGPELAPKEVPPGVTPTEVDRQF